jgi:hypothetical protein
MRTEKRLAALVLCLAVLWGSRFGPYSCAALAGFPVEVASWVKGAVVAGALLTGFLYVPAYDLVSFLTYKLGWEKSFDPIDVYPGDPPDPRQAPISQKLKLRLFYPLDLAAVIFVLLPTWTKVAYCG